MGVKLTIDPEILVSPFEALEAVSAKATAAASSANAASASATAAAGSATSASGSASTATTQAGNASSSASAAATSEANALTYKSAAQTAQTNAETAETNAEAAQAAAELAEIGAQTAKTAAETARDSTYNLSTTYLDIATGRAAVADGAQFDVAAIGATEVIRYRRDSSSTQTELNRFPTSAGVVTKAIMAPVIEAYDLETDRLAPYFINVRDFTKSHVTPSTFNVATIASRDSDTQFTVNAGQGSNFVANGACVILDDDGDYHPVAVQSVSGDVVTSAETLPATCASAQTMHETTNGQHLSDYGYAGLADFIATRTVRHSYRKAHLIWYWHPPITKSIAFNDPKIYALDGVTIEHSPTILGSATGGGFVAGTGNLAKELRMSSANENITSLPLNYYLSRSYLIQQGTSGQGIKFTIPVNKMDGFLEIPISSNRVLYDTTLYTAGEARVLVEGDGATISDQNVAVGPMQRLFVDFSGVNELQVSFMLATTTPTSIKLHGLYAWMKSAETSSSEKLFRNGDAVAFLGDSWTQFPAGTALTRPDGSTGDGEQLLSERLRAKLLADGIKVTTLNMGKGGTTSEWGRYWVHSILSLTPRPNKCIIQFWINDYNSNSFSISGADAAYDFDPANQWAFKLQSLGGRKGSVTYDEWFKNIKEISDTLAMNGIKPIILLPCHLGAGAQTQGVQQNMLNKIAVGFRNINELGGGA